MGEFSKKVCECFHTPVNSAQYRDVPRTTRKGKFKTPQLNEDAFRLFLVDSLKMQTMELH